MQAGPPQRRRADENAVSELSPTRWYPWSRLRPLPLRRPERVADRHLRSGGRTRCARSRCPSPGTSSSVAERAVSGARDLDPHGRRAQRALGAADVLAHPSPALVTDMPHRAPSGSRQPSALLQAPPRAAFEIHARHVVRKPWSSRSSRRERRCSGRSPRPHRPASRSTPGVAAPITATLLCPPALVPSEEARRRCPAPGASAGLRRFTLWAPSRFSPGSSSSCGEVRDGAASSRRCRRGVAPRASPSADSKTPSSDLRAVTSSRGPPSTWAR